VTTGDLAQSLGVSPSKRGDAAVLAKQDELLARLGRGRIVALCTFIHFIPESPA
jgi:hypothetical protein